LAKLLPRDVDYSETPTLFSKSLKVCLDEYLNRFLARINLNPNGRIPKVDLVSATILSSNNGMRHFYFAPQSDYHSLPGLIDISGTASLGVYNG
jgi:hypothetical protein